MRATGLPAAGNGTAREAWHYQLICALGVEPRGLYGFFAKGRNGYASSIVGASALTVSERTRELNTNMRFGPVGSGASVRLLRKTY